MTYPLHICITVFWIFLGKVFFKTAGLKWDIADSIIDSVNKIYILKQIDHEVHHQHEDIL